MSVEFGGLRNQGHSKQFLHRWSVAIAEKLTLSYPLKVKTTHLVSMHKILNRLWNFESRATGLSLPFLVFFASNSMGMPGGPHVGQ